MYLRLRRGILFEMTFAGVIIVYHDDIKEVIIFIFNFCIIKTVLLFMYLKLSPKIRIDLLNRKFSYNYM